MFQIKDFSSITAAIINHARSSTQKVTDWVPGSVARTLAEAPAVEIEELYLQMFLGLREAIPVSAFKSFGFEKLPAVYARGYVSVSVESPLLEDIPVPVGTEFNTDDGRSYFSADAVTFASGETLVRIPVAAEAAGASYNASAGTINSSPLFASGSFTVSNSLIESGSDIESDQEQEARFAEFIASLSRGTVVACLYAANSAVVLDEDGNIYERVTRAGLSEFGGFVRIYIYTTRGIASAEIINIAQTAIDGYRDEVTGERFPGYRAGGVRCDIIPMVERSVDFAAQVRTVTGYTLNSQMIQSLNNAYADALAAAEPGGILYMGTLIEDLLSVSGVLTVVPSSNSNIVCGVNEALKPGAVTFTPLI